MTLKMIVAVNGQNIIGLGNTIPWFHKGDLKFFKEKTTGNVVIMGRKTWESLPAKMRPLPDRVNMVVSSTCPWDAAAPPANCWWAPSVDAVVGTAKELYPSKDVWFIGGARIYEAAMPLVEEVVMSEIPDHVDTAAGSCVYWPGLDLSLRLDRREPHPHTPELSVTYWRRPVTPS